MEARRFGIEVISYKLTCNGIPDVAGAVSLATLTTIV